MNDKIMIVDDEEHIRFYYSEELEDEGYEVVTVSNGFRLLEKIEKEMPDLVILDVRMRDYDGLDLLQGIKNMFYHMPVGLCTAYDTYKDDMKSVAADFYVVKSYDLSNLKENIAKTLDVPKPDSSVNNHIPAFA
ncbi:MAG: response regulator [Desulfobacteraceae bacterium]|jgi:DNA-binding NtrC family response regulator